MDPVTDTCKHIVAGLDALIDERDCYQAALAAIKSKLAVTNIYPPEVKALHDEIFVLAGNALSAKKAKRA